MKGMSLSRAIWAVVGGMNNCEGGGGIEPASSPSRDIPATVRRDTALPVFQVGNHTVSQVGEFDLLSSICCFHPIHHLLYRTALHISLPLRL
jgi:hypothetical protein